MRKRQRVRKTKSIYEEEVKNNNGKSMIDFCIMNKLTIMNTYYNHKDKHKYMTEMANRGKKFMIDYIIINNSYKNDVKDTRVRRSAEPYTLHLVLAKIKIESDRRLYKNSRREKNASTKETIWTYNFYK